MRAFQWTLRVLALIPLVTGLLEVTMGIGSLSTLGVEIPADVSKHPSVDNGWRFLGAVWAGYALLIWYAVHDVVRHATLLRIILGLLFFSGVARATSVFLTGWPVAPFIAAMVFELVAMPSLYWWLNHLVSKRHAKA
jgi:Domain of unknown function (DUF4345)